MTAAERLLLGAVRETQRQFSTGASFTLDGHASVTFTGIVSEEQNLLSLVPGGNASERQIRIVVTKEQFEAEEITPDRGMSLNYHGSRFIITSIPNEHSDPIAYTFICDQPQKGGRR